MKNLTTRGDAHVVIARDRNGKQIWRTLGPVKEWSGRKKDLEAEVIRIRQAIREGRPTSGPETFAKVVDDFFRLHVEQKQLRTARAMRQKLDLHAMPEWGAKDFESIRRGDVIKLIDRVAANSGPIAADCLQQQIGKICNWYAIRNDDYINPIIRGMRRTSSKERARTRILTDDEIRALWNAKVNPFRLAFVKLALLTAQRREKILTMRWEDIQNGVWTIPSEKREKGTAGELVLSDTANEVLDTLCIDGKRLPDPKVFPYWSGCTTAGLKRQLDAAVPLPHWTLHDLRRTARSLMARAGVQPHIAERVLGHVIGGVEGIYDRHSYRTEKAEAVRKLAGLLELINPTASNVVQMAR